MSKKKRKHRLDPNLLIAVGVLVTSVSALFVYINQASIMREQTQILLEQTKANSWPHVNINCSIGRSDDSIHIYKYRLANKGTGPAILEQTLVTVKGKAVKNWEDFYNALNLKDSIFSGHSTKNIFEIVLSANEEIEIIDWSNTEGSTARTASMRHIHQRADSIAIKVCYSSIHGDRWITERTGFKSNLEPNIRKKVDKCPYDKADLFIE